MVLASARDGEPMRSLRAACSAVLSLAIAFVLLVGTPFALIQFVGNPFPTVVPSWDDVSYAVTNGQIDAWTWVKGLALVGWVAWANLVAGFVVELVAAVRGARARAVRGLAATQWLAGRLIANCTLAGSLVFQSTVGASAIGGLPPLPVVSAPLPASSTPAVELASSSPEPAEEPGLSIDVGRRDTLWGLAETHLGDGEKWVAIRDANVGRTMPDGTVLGSDFTGVSKGWTMLIPQGSTVETRPGATVSVPTERIEIEAGDNLWRLAADRLEADEREPDDADVLRHVAEVVAENDDAIDDPDLIYPGQVFTFPEIRSERLRLGSPTAAVETDGRAEPIGTHQGRTASLRGGVPAPGSSADSTVIGDHQDDGWAEVERDADQPLGVVVAAPVPPSVESVDPDGASSPGGDGPLERVAFVGMGAAGALLAAGARRTLMRRRRYALAHRKPGTVPRQPNPELATIERLVHRRADDAALRWLEAAMGSLATRPIWAGEHVAQPVGVTWRADTIDVEFTATDPMAAPLPWVTHDGGRHWTLPRSTAIKDLPTAGPDDPVPTLITVGLGRLLNLEGIGLLSVSGGGDPTEPGDNPMDAVRSIVHELATSTSAGTIDIRTTIAVEGVEGYDLVQLQTASSLNDELVPWLEGLAPRLDESLATNAFAYRIVSEDEPMAPVVVVTDSAGLEEMATLASLAQLRTLPIAVVVCGEVDAEFSLAFSGGSARLDPWAETIEPLLLSAPEARQLGELLVSAVSPGEDPLVAGLQLSAPAGGGPRHEVVDGSAAAALVRVEPVADRQTPDASARPEPLPASAASNEPLIEDEPVIADGPAVVDGPGLTVRVLGDVEVVGIESALTSQQLSLLTYLACHGPSSKEAIVDALWDGQVISRSRFPNLLAELRSRIGRQHLPEARNARYELAGVTTDLIDFERRVGMANKQPTQEAVVTLRAALDLVRGIPLTPPGRRFWSWVGDETYLAARVEALVADTAARLARIEQDLGNLDGAQQACEQGLNASPTDESLVIVLTEVYMMQGKPGLARRLVERWEDKISRLECGEPSDEPRRRLAG